MRAVHSWLRELVPGLPDAHACADALTDAGLKVESVELFGFDVVAADGSSGVVVGEVVTIEELTEFKKPIRFVEVRVSADGPLQGIVCGATNFAVGDRVPVALPGAVLPGGFAIGARETYGRVSEGMICSARELGLGDDHRGIRVLPGDTPLGADVQALVGWPDAVLDIEVTTDRGYALTHRGIARELATAFGLEFHDPADLALPAPVGSAGEVRIEDSHGCSHYVLRRMHGAQLVTSATSSLADQARLIAAGMRPISRIVDVTNLVLLGIGQPLHAFDAAKIEGAVVIRRAAAGERLQTLDGVDRTLSTEDLVIADALGPVALAGVMGGARTEISGTTTEVALESAHFDPTLIARTSRRHGLTSEASRRFERGVDPELARYGAELAARMLLGDAAADGVHLTEVGTPLKLAPVTLPAGECERLGGRVYPVPTIRLRLTQVGCTVTGDDPLIVQPPSWRPDLTRAADLVEEVLRLEGYRTIPVTLPRAPAGRGLTAGQRARRRVTAAIADAGFAEVLLLPFVAGDVAVRLGLEPDDPRRAAVRVANPLSDDEAYLRTSLLPGLLSAAARNASRGNPDVALFEMGTVFFSSGPREAAPIPPVDRRPTPEELLALEAMLPHQPTHVGAVLTGQRLNAGPLQTARSADWADAVSAAHIIARAAGATLDVGTGALAPWHPGRCAQLSVLTADGPRLVGHAGELHPRVVAEAELPARACALELDLGVLVAAADPPPVLPPLSPYPAADRDVALLVPSGVSASAVEAALRSGGGPDLETLRLFDDFTTADGQRSLAYRLRWRAGRTLTAEEVNGLRDTAVAEAVTRTGAQQRA
ncbi:MAG TPA: phenylalanine--tRNA ligase subunit beta [Frankiaceae bacterium]|jgi:phenylalanyl-tRNA synthetase beta chain|nr:phenylalanine--tRNA ligase subunit beta [Frankiaceae bacterium]